MADAGGVPGRRAGWDTAALEEGSTLVGCHAFRTRRLRRVRDSRGGFADVHDERASTLLRREIQPREDGTVDLQSDTVDTWPLNRIASGQQWCSLISMEIPLDPDAAFEKAAHLLEQIIPGDVALVLCSGSTRAELVYPAAAARS